MSNLNCNAPSTSGTYQSHPQAMNLEINIWSKVSDAIKEKCVSGKSIFASEKRAVSKICADYMLNTLKTTIRSVARDIAKQVCDKYPNSFADSINYHESWGCGYESLFQQIYNGVLYRAKINESKHTPNKRSLALDDDSDDDAQSQREQEIESKKKQDIYGCVNYAPLLPNDETPETQEALRLKLLELFNVDKSNKDIGDLMVKTYPTLRATINDANKDLNLISEMWPFFQMSEYFIAHCAHLLDKDVLQLWTDSIEKRIKITGQYLKSVKLKDEIKNKIIALVDESKSASIVTKNRIPRNLLVFRLLILHFQEDEECFFKIKHVS